MEHKYPRVDSEVATTSIVPADKAGSSIDFGQEAKEDGGNLIRYSQSSGGGSSVGVVHESSRSLGHHTL
jgi:hypothetical protein